MKLSGTALLLFFLLLFQSCSQPDEKDCNGICSQEYRTITVNIINEEAEPVALDSFKVTALKDGRDLTLEVDESSFQLMQKTGTYPIFSDRHFYDYSRQQLDINFTGFIEGEEVLSEDYRVGADCCHVYYIAGELNPVL